MFSKNKVSKQDTEADRTFMSVLLKKFRLSDLAFKEHMKKAESTLKKARKHGLIYGVLTRDAIKKAKDLAERQLELQPKNPTGKTEKQKMADLTDFIGNLEQLTEMCFTGEVHHMMTPQEELKSKMKALEKTEVMVSDPVQPQPTQTIPTQVPSAPPSYTAIYPTVPQGQSGQFQMIQSQTNTTQQPQNPTQPQFVAPLIEIVDEEGNIIKHLKEGIKLAVFPTEAEREQQEAIRKGIVDLRHGQVQIRKDQVMQLGKFLDREGQTAEGMSLVRKSLAEVMSGETLALNTVCKLADNVEQLAEEVKNLTMHSPDRTERSSHNTTQARRQEETGSSESDSDRDSVESRNKKTSTEKRTKESKKAGKRGAQLRTPVHQSTPKSGGPATRTRSQMQKQGKYNAGIEREISRVVHLISDLMAEKEKLQAELKRKGKTQGNRFDRVMELTKELERQQGVLHSLREIQGREGGETETGKGETSSEHSDSESEGEKGEKGKPEKGSGKKEVEWYPLRQCKGTQSDDEIAAYGAIGEEGLMCVLDTQPKKKLRTRHNAGKGKVTSDHTYLYPVSTIGNNPVVRCLNPQEMDSCRQALEKNHPNKTGGIASMRALLSVIPASSMTLQDLLQLTEQTLAPLKPGIERLIRLETGEAHAAQSKPDFSVLKYFKEVRDIFSDQYPVRADNITDMDLTPLENETASQMAKRLESILDDLTSDCRGNTEVYRSLLLTTLKGQVSAAGLEKIDYLSQSDNSYLQSLCAIRIKEEQKRKKQDKKDNNSATDALAQSTAEATKAMVKIMEMMADKQQVTKQKVKKKRVVDSDSEVEEEEYFSQPQTQTQTRQPQMMGQTQYVQNNMATLRPPLQCTLCGKIGHTVQKCFQAPGAQGQINFQQFQQRKAARQQQQMMQTGQPMMAMSQPAVMPQAQALTQTMQYQPQAYTPQMQQQQFSVQQPVAMMPQQQTVAAPQFAQPMTQTQQNVTQQGPAQLLHLLPQ